MQTLKTDAFFLIFQTGLSGIPSCATGDTHSLPLNANGTIGKINTNSVLTHHGGRTLYNPNNLIFDTHFYYLATVETGTATLLHISFEFSNVVSITFNLTGTDRLVQYSIFFLFHTTFPFYLFKHVALDDDIKLFLRSKQIYKINICKDHTEIFFFK